MNLASKSGAKMVFGLNIMHNRVNQSKEYPEGLWDPQNARDMISYALSQHFDFYGFELGQYHNPWSKMWHESNLPKITTGSVPVRPRLLLLAMSTPHILFPYLCRPMPALFSPPNPRFNLLPFRGSLRQRKEH